MRTTVTDAQEFLKLAKGCEVEVVSKYALGLTPPTASTPPKSGPCAALTYTITNGDNQWVFQQLVDIEADATIDVSTSLWAYLLADPDVTIRELPKKLPENL